jgi:heat shock protein HtpX
VWEQIRSNRLRSIFVVISMGVLLVAMGAGFAYLFGGGTTKSLLIGGGAAFALWVVLWIGSAKSGDKVLLSIAGAKEIEHADHPQLINIVEEMTIAAELPHRPRVFIVDDPSPNAFATGKDPRWAGVSVTTGLLRILDRDELQGVVAHEIGHIKNRDVALMTTAGVMAGCIVLLAELGLRMMWYGGGHRRSRSSGKDNGGQAVLMLISILLLILAPILAQIIYFALSRRREYLADASGARFTRYPEGLARALEKLGGAQVPLSDESKVTAPMYIVKPFRAAKGSGGSMFSTHPPLQERVKILRGMGGAADYRAYETAYRKVHGGSVVGARTLVAAQPVEARGATPAAAAAMPTSERGRQREAMDAFLSASGYEREACPSCDAVLKIPPEVAQKMSQCPRCGAPR